MTDESNVVPIRDPNLIGETITDKEYMEQARPILYRYKVENINTIEDVRTFIKEMGVSLVVYPGQTFDQFNKTADLWQEVPFPNPTNPQSAA